MPEFRICELVVVRVAALRLSEWRTAAFFGPIPVSDSQPQRLITGCQASSDYLTIFPRLHRLRRLKVSRSVAIEETRYNQ